MIVYLLLWFSTTSALIVETPLGAIRGFQHKTVSGSTVNVFLGVRYAQNPSGNLRFEKPVMVEPWKNVKDATEYGPTCFPDHRNSLENNTSEDCLSVNFIVPSEKTDKPYPVLVYIHWGGFVTGTARSHGYKGAAEHFASKGIIVVTIQYRIGFLGFMSAADKTLPGNLGLWDQTMALQFIRKILPSLGGDVNRITVAGLSAGSASVTHLLASTHSNNLFSQAIQISASGLADWTFNNRVIEDSLIFSSRAGCGGKSLKKCMKEKTIEELYDAMDTVGNRRNHLNMFKFHPRFDGDFFTEDLNTLLKKAPKKKTMQGVAKQENFFFTVELKNNPLYLTEKKRETFGVNDIEEFLKTGAFDEARFGKEADELRDWATRAYADPGESHNSTFYALRYTDIGSDIMFNIPIHEEIQLKIQNGWETYHWVTDYITDSIQDSSGLWRGASHGTELRYLFDYEGTKGIPFNEEDRRFQDILVSAFVNFITKGSPSADSVVWHPATLENPGRHLRMNPNAYMSDEMFRQSAINVWLKRFPKDYGKDTLRKFFPGVGQRRTEHEEL